jgi:hypothetical protein
VRTRCRNRQRRRPVQSPESRPLSPAVFAPQQEIVFSTKRLRGRIRIAKADMTPVSFCGGDFSMKILLTAAALVAFAVSPASAAMMACTSDNMMKSAAMMGGTADTPAKTAMNKEMAMANTDMSNGKMKSACMHYMKAQKAMSMK